MQLAIASDASYLTESGARSRAGGLHYLSSRSPTPNQWRHPRPLFHHEECPLLCHRGGARRLL
jgi:hypothetical protein